jgi:translocation and assembly module TamB
LLLWLLASLLIILAIAIFALQLSPVQTYLAGKFTDWLSSRTGTVISIEAVEISFPESVGLKNVFIEDRYGDTLLFAGSLYAEIRMTALLRNRVHVGKLELDGLTANIKREKPDTVFNFQFLADAFGNGEPPSGEEQEEQEDTLDLRLDIIQLSNINITFEDHYPGLALNTRFAFFRTSLSGSELLKGKYHAGRTELGGSKTEIIAFTPTVPPGPEDAEQSDLGISVESFEIEDVAFLYNDLDGGTISASALMLNIIPEEIDLPARLIGITSILADSLHASVHRPETAAGGSGREQVPETEREPEFDFSEIMEWTIRLDNIFIDNSSFTMAENPASMQGGEFDPDNFHLGSFMLSAGNIYAGPDSLNIAIDSMNMIISESFAVDRFSLFATLGTSAAKAELKLRTAETWFGFNFSSRAGLLNFAFDDLAGKEFDLLVHDSHLGSDLAWFFPETRSYYFDWPGNQGIELGGRISGTPDRFEADNFRVEAPGFASLSADGEIEGLIGQALQLDIERFDLHALPGPIMANLPDTLHPEGITLPEYISIDGRFKGDIQVFEAALEIGTNFGNIEITGSAREGPLQETIFQGKAYTPSFDIGRMMQLDILPEPLSLQADMAGRGTEPENMEMKAAVTVGDLQLMDYSYQDIVLDFSLKDSVVSLWGSYTDGFLAYDINAVIGIFTEIIFGKGTLDIYYADLQELGISEDELQLGVELQTDLVFDIDDFFNGHVRLADFTVSTGDELYHVPEIALVSDCQPGDYTASVSSEFLSASYKGNFSPMTAPSVIARHFSEYFRINDFLSPVNNNRTGVPALADQTGGITEEDRLDGPESIQESVQESVPESVPGDGYFDLELTLYPDDIIGMILPENILEYDTLHVSMNYDAGRHSFSMEASIDELQYNDTRFSKLDIIADSDPSELNFGIYLDSIGFNQTGMHDVSLTGSLFDQTLDMTLSARDAAERELVWLRPVIENRDGLFHITIDSDKLIINREPWQIHPENLVVFGSEYLHVSDFIIEEGQAWLSVTSHPHEKYDNVLEISFHQFDLARLTGFIEDEQAYIGGVLNGDITLRDIFGVPSFVADMHVQDISWSGQTIESISLQAEDASPGQIDVSLNMEHGNSLLTAEGRYLTAEPAFDINIGLERIDLHFIQAFAADHLAGAEGSLSGWIHVAGTPDQPELTGNLYFNKTAFNIVQMNTGFSIDEETIILDGNNLVLEDFTLADNRGGEATISGILDFSDMENLVFNLGLTANDFLLMDTRQGQDEMYHGRILIDSDLRLTGTHINPSVEGSMKLLEGSDFAFTIPQPDPEIIAQEGVVQFIRFDMPELIHEEAPVETTSPLTGIDINLNLEIDRETRLTVIIDEIAGDNLEIQGGGDLVFGIDPGGKVSLTGAFEVQEGNYLLTFYDVIRREFAIEPGSTIVWTGDPMEAELDITAIYTINTSPRELMSTHIEGDQIQTARLRQQFPFQVHLNLEGNLGSPHISFELGMPPGNEMALDGSLIDRINQINQNESELNKQVISLLLLGTFLQENPLDRPGEGGIGATARTSGSRLMTQQLNRMADRYVRGVNITFDIESYEEQAGDDVVGRTELEMEISRDFFDDRVRVTVAGNIELEDETHRESRPGEIAGDFSLEYLITPEGNLIIKGFRLTDFNDLFEGEIVETGISLMYSRNFSRLRELFRRERQ